MSGRVAWTKSGRSGYGRVEGTLVGREWMEMSCRRMTVAGWKFVGEIDE